MLTTRQPAAVVSAARGRRPPRRRARADRHPRGRLPRPHRPGVPRMSSTGAFKALSVAIVKGFVRDKTSVFFAVVFPLMFLVLFGGLFADQTQSKVDLIEVGDVSLIDDLPDGADDAFEDTFEIEDSDDLDAALEEGPQGRRRRGGRDAGRHVGRALHPDRPGEGRDHAGCAAGVRGRDERRAALVRRRHAAEVRPRDREGRGRLAQDHPVLHARAARLGGRDERRLRRRGDDPGLAAVQADPAPPARAGLDPHRGRRPGLGDGGDRAGAAGDLRRARPRRRSGSPSPAPGGCRSRS